MQLLSTLFGVLGIVGGLIFFILALVGASNYPQATFYGVMSIAAFAFTGVLLLAGRDREDE